MFDPAVLADQPKRTPRAYQAEFFEAWRTRRHEGRGKLAVAFTGAGKSFMATMAIRDTPGRCLFLVNRTFLRIQMMETLARDSGRRWQLEQADAWAKPDANDSVIALVQTMIQPHPEHGARHKRFPRDHFSLIVVDEVHKMWSKRYREVLEYFETAEILAFTATPGNIDYKPLLSVVVQNYPLNKARQDAWSVDFEYITYETDVNLKGVKWSGGDWSRDELDRVIAHAAGAIAKAAVTEAYCPERGYLRNLVFCPGINAIEAVVAAINAIQPGSARPLHSKLPDGVKRVNVADHKAGVFQHLVSCDMIREGYDDQRIQAITLAKPMGNAWDYEQVIGRGSRISSAIGAIVNEDERRAAIAASDKPKCRLIDLACVSEKHKLITVIDVLGGDYTEAERKLAKQAMDGEAGRGKKPKDKSGGRDKARRDPAAALEWARRELAKREELGKLAASAEVKLTRKKQKPPERLTPDGSAVAMTEGQCRDLDRFGLPYDEHTTKEFALGLSRTEYLRARQFGGWLPDHALDWVRNVAGVPCQLISLDRAKAIKERYLSTWPRRPLTKDEILETARIKNRRRDDNDQR